MPRQLNEEWTADVVREMHLYRITRQELASKCHYSLTYLSLVLNGNKTFSSDYAKERTKAKILKSLEEIKIDILTEIEMEKEEVEERPWYEYFNKT